MSEENRRQLTVSIVLTVIMGIILSLLIFVYVLNNWNSLPESITGGRKITVKTVEEINVESNEIIVGNKGIFEVKVKPINMTDNDIQIAFSNDSIISIDEITYKNSGDYTVFTVNFSAVNIGETEMKFASVNGEVSSIILLNVVDEPIVQGFGKFSEQSFYIGENGSKKITIPFKPANLSIEDFEVTTSEDGVVSVSNDNVQIVDGVGILTLQVDAISLGKTSIRVNGADGQTISDKLDVTVIEEYLLRKVYINATGDKYHYKSSCAGKSEEVTLYDALRRGKEACLKCTK